MKKSILLSLFVISLIGANMKTVKAESYRISDLAIESVFNSATVISSEVFNSNDPSFSVLSTKATTEKSALAALVIDFFLGGLGIHRVYLGGKGILVVGYLFTCGGIFGIVPFIDLIVLAVNYDDISKYVGNNKFFMW